MAAKFSDKSLVAFHGRKSVLGSEREVLATIAETTDAFIQVADLNYRWLAINKASADEFERIFGVRPRVGMSMLDILADRPEHQAAVKAVWSRALAGEEFTEIGEFGDSDRRFYEMRYNRLIGAGGEQIGAFQIVTDVTERVRAQQQLERAAAALRQSQKMEAIGQLTGGLAHDFNNLLQIIAGNLDLLQRNLPAGQPRLKRWAENAMRGAARATELAHRLLAFSKPAQGIQTVVDANCVVAGMADLIRHAVGDRITVEFKLMHRPAAIRVDPNQLESAILNLVVNARDSMPEGGRLLISTATGEGMATPPPSAAADGSQMVVISVADSGVGMDESIQSRLFEPFFTTKEPGRGTGLGLAMVHSFVHMAGGFVRLQSRPGQGSTFHLGFPSAPDAELGRTASTSLQPPRSRSNQLVLVVEDDDDVRQHAVELLRDLGYRVLEAHDGQAALSLLAKHKSDIALMFCDVGLPHGMRGQDLAVEARRLNPELRILYTSGSVDGEGFETPSGDLAPLIAKPFSAADLAQRIQQVLDRSPLAGAKRSRRRS